MEKRVGIIGAGVVGTAVGIILSQGGWKVTGVYDKHPESTVALAGKVGAKPGATPDEVSRSVDILFITTSDSAIKEVVGVIARKGGFRQGQIVVHMSGALSSEVMREARDHGVVLLSIHPLQSFASEERAVQNLPGSVFSIEGDEAGYQVAEKIVESLGGEYFFIDGKVKPLYHAAACVVSNYLVTLVEFGIRLMEVAGIPRRSALRALMPLIEGTVNNIATIGIPAALTGPIARGDVSTVGEHLERLHEMAPELVNLYSLLGYHTADVARAKGTIDEATREGLHQLFGNELSNPTKI